MEKQKQNNPLNGLVHSATDMASQTADLLGSIGKVFENAIPFFVDGIDRQVIPPLPGGHTVLINASTHHGKTQAANLWVDRAVQHFRESGRDDKVIVVIDRENTLEEIGLTLLQRAKVIPNMAQMLDSGVRQVNVAAAGMTLARIGNIIYIAPTMGGSYSLINIDMVMDALEEIASGKLFPNLPRNKQGGVDIAMIVVDYLQSLAQSGEISVETMTKEHQYIAYVFERIFAAAKRYGAATLVTSQAKQKGDLDGLPGLMGAPGTRGVSGSKWPAERTERHISLYMPKSDFSLGDFIEYRGASIQVTPGLFVLRNLKQRPNLPSGHVIFCNWIIEDGVIVGARALSFERGALQ